MKRGMLFIVVLIVLMAPVFCYAESVTVTKLGDWGTGYYSQVAVKGNYAYCTAESIGMDVLDISVESNPVKVGSCVTLGGNAFDIKVSGNYAYVAESGQYFHIIDISNPTHPFLVSSYKSMNFIGHISVSGNYAYITERSAGMGRLLIVDIRNPLTPVMTGISQWYDAFDGIEVSGDYAYLTNSYDDSSQRGRLLIFDISNKTSPELVGSFDQLLFPGKPAKSGNYIYVTASLSGFYVIDVSTPSNPVQVGFYPMPSGYYGNVVASGNYAYVTFGKNGYKVFDISSPSNPTLVNSLNTTHYLMSSVVSGSYAYLAAYDGGLEIVDISNPGNSSSLTVVGSYNESYRGIDLAISGNYGVLATNGKGVKILNISNSSKLAPVGAFDLSANARKVVLSGNYAYVLDRETGLHILDISDKSHPIEVGNYDGVIDYEYLAVSGNYVYAGFIWGWENKIRIVDVSDKTAPTLVASISMTSEDILNIAVSGNYMYVTDRINVGGKGLIIFDISVKSNPKRVGYLKLSDDSEYQSTVGLVVSGNYVYMAGESVGFKIVDVSDPTNPVLKGSNDMGEAPIGIALSGNYAFVLDRVLGLYVYNIISPSSPQLIGLESSLTGADISISGDKIYIVGGRYGTISIYRFSIVNGNNITVTAPNGGEKWQVGTSYNITWTQFGLSGNVTIDLYKGNTFYSSIGVATASSGVFSWVIPSNMAASNDYKVRISQGGISDYSNSNFSITAPTSIGLSRKNLYFKSVSGVSTPVQSVIIGNTGGGTLNWSATADQTWLTVSPASGSGNGSIQVGVNPIGVAPGEYWGNISVSDPNAVNSPQVISVKWIVSEYGSVPFGEFSTPTDGITVSGSVPVTGWTLDDVGVTYVKIYRDAVSGEAEGFVYIGDAVFVEGARPDVESAYPDYPLNYRAGWGYMLLTNFLPGQGNGTFTLYARALDKEGNIVTLGTKTIICDNAHAVKPFGSIDTPMQGGSVSGSSYVNFGWVLTPSPNTIPIDGSTITIWVDGAPVGKPVYNQYREDIALLFPGLNNSNGAVGYYYIDMTKYSNGLHTISWSVKDNAGNEEGIGSRYFNVQNAGQNIAMALTDIFADRSEENVSYFEIEELGRVEINLPRAERIDGYFVVGDRLRALPIGSTLDKEKGIFYWQPGPGFLGTYRFEFLLTDREGTINKKILEIKVGFYQSFWSYREGGALFYKKGIASPR